MRTYYVVESLKKPGHWEWESVLADLCFQELVNANAMGEHPPYVVAMVEEEGTGCEHNEGHRTKCAGWEDYE